MSPVAPADVLGSTGISVPGGAGWCGVPVGVPGVQGYRVVPGGAHVPSVDECIYGAVMAARPG